jgi:hypothetical protein
MSCLVLPMNRTYRLGNPLTEPSYAVSIVPMGKTGRFLHTGVVYWSDQDGDTWRINITWAEVGGRAEPVGLSMFSYGERMSDEGELVALGPSLRPIRTAVLRGNLMAAIENDRKFTVHRAASILGARSAYTEDIEAEGEEEVAPAVIDPDIEALLAPHLRLARSLGSDGRIALTPNHLAAFTEAERELKLHSARAVPASWSTPTGTR